jgi:hypothetical protein
VAAEGGRESRGVLASYLSIRCRNGLDWMLRLTYKQPVHRSNSPRWNLILDLLKGD